MKKIIRAFKALLSNFSFSSQKYWENRYRKGGDSGAGSYGKVSNFKGEFINDFIKTNGVKSMIDYGCGDGNQASFLRIDSYLGIDVSSKAIDICKKKFESNSNFQFKVYSDVDFSKTRADLLISMDVLYHLVEDKVFLSYLDKLFLMSTKYVIIFSTNFNRTNVIHHKDREFLPLVQNKFKDWKFVQKAENPFKGEDSLADFYIFERK